MSRPEIDLSVIPEDLIQKYGSEVFSTALAAIYWRRREIDLDQKKPTRPKPVEIQPAAEIQPAGETPTGSRPTGDQASSVKIWPSLLLSAFQGNHGGAGRIYFLARSLDRDGRGWIEVDELVAFLRSLRVGERKRRRWSLDAVRLGLFHETIFKKTGKRVYFLAGLARAALAVDAARVGRPAGVDPRDLVSIGWRSLVWSAYLQTLNDRPVSQARKAELTGVSERVQRLYQARQPGSKIQNFVDRGRAARGRAAGLRESCNIHVFEWRGRAIQKLPDIRSVPSFLASRLPRGRSKKAQAALNDSLSFVRQAESSGGDVRLFCDNVRQVKASLRRVARSEMAACERPAEVFEHVDHRRGVNRWRAVPVCEIVP